MAIIGMPQNYEGELDAECLIESERIKENVERFKRAMAIVEKKKKSDFKSGKAEQNKVTNQAKKSKGGEVESEDGDEGTDQSNDRGEY